MKFKLLYFGLFILLLPWGAYGYHVSGKVDNGTKQQPLAQYPVAVKEYQGNQEKVVAVDTTSPQGEFEFSGLKPNKNYGLSVAYQMVKYEDLRWNKPFPKDHPLHLTVYDTTRSDTSVRITMQHEVLTEGEGKLFVRQIMRVENTSDKAFIGTVPVSKNSYKSLAFQIPPGATNVQAGKGFMQCCIGFNGNEFYDTMELLPGSKDLVLYYEIPVNSKQFVFRDKADYPIDSYVALIKRQKATVQSQMLNTLETAADPSFVQLAANKVKRGEVIPIKFENFLQPPKNYGTYFIGLFVLVLAGGIVFAKKGKNKILNSAQEQNMPRDPVCQMPVPEEDRSYTTVYNGDTYYFCCEKCQESFEAEPEEYLAATE